MIISSIICFNLLFTTQPTRAQSNNKTQSSLSKVTSLKITTLSTMLASQGIGEWGYSALVEANGEKILFDTGNKPDTVLKNAEELGIDLSEVENVFISHNHSDHTGGLITLRQHLKQRNPKALSKIHVAQGIFNQRLNSDNKILDIKSQLEADGVEFIIHSKPSEIFPGVWTTAPVERKHNEKNWGDRGRIKIDNQIVKDNIPEDQSLAIYTSKGFVLISGCGHAGIINTLEHVTAQINADNIYAIIGGFHLVSASEEKLAWTAKHLKKFGVINIIGAHCTGLNSLYALRKLLNLSERQAVVGSVGDHFSLHKGILAGIIAR